LLHQMPPTLTHQSQVILIQLQTMTTSTEIDQKVTNIHYGLPRSTCCLVD
jgi:hypothetical protein